jgi:hypothetical protein
MLGSWIWSCQPKRFFIAIFALGVTQSLLFARPLVEPRQFVVFFVTT